MNVDKEVKRLRKAENAIAERDRKLAVMQAAQEQARDESDAAKERLALILLRRRRVFELPAAQFVALLSHVELPHVAVRGAIIASAPPLEAEEMSKEASRVTADTVEVTVQISRNSGQEKRAVLSRAGLRWNGKSGRWVGKVDRALLAELQSVFGERVATRQLVVETAPAALAAPVATDEAVGPSETPPEPRQAATDVRLGISGGEAGEAVQEGSAPALPGLAATLPPARVLPRPLPRLGGR